MLKLLDEDLGEKGDFGAQNVGNFAGIFEKLKLGEQGPINEEIIFSSEDEFTLIWSWAKAVRDSDRMADFHHVVIYRILNRTRIPFPFRIHLYLQN